MSVKALNRIVNKVIKEAEIKLPTQVSKAEGLVNGLISKVEQQIPTIETIKGRICTPSNLDAAKRAYNTYNNLLSKLNILISKAQILIESLNQAIEFIRNLLQSLLKFLEVLSFLANTLKLAIPALTAALVAIVPPYASGGAISILMERKQDIKDKVNLFSNVIKGMIKFISFILPRLEIIDNQIINLIPNFDNLSNAFQRVKNSLDNCLKERLLEQPAITYNDLNTDLETLIDNENNNQGIKIQEFKFTPINALSYKVRNIPLEEFKN